MAIKCLQVQLSLWNLPGYETILGGLPWRQQQQLRGSGRRMQIGRSQWSRHHSVRSSMSGGFAARAGGNVSQSDANGNAEDLASSSSSSSSSSDARQGIISANVLLLLLLLSTKHCIILCVSIDVLQLETLVGSI
jgi:hypothetical protein